MDLINKLLGGGLPSFNIGSLGNVGSSLGSNNLLLFLVAFYGFSFLRRIALFSVRGLLPIAAIMYFMASKDPGVSNLIGNVAGNSAPSITGMAAPGMFDGLTSKPYFIPGLVLFALYFFSRTRYVSLGMALCFFAAGMMLSGQTIALPSSIASEHLSLPLVILIVAVALYKIVPMFLARRVSYGNYSYIIPAPLSFKSVNSRRARAFLMMVSVVFIALLYFAPALPTRYIPGWTPVWASYAFAASLGLLGVLGLLRVNIDNTEVRNYSAPVSR